MISDGEQWVFGGSRVNKALLFKPAGGGYCVGGLYEVRVGRAGERVTLYDKAGYTGERTEDQTLVDGLAAKHRAAEEVRTCDTR